MGRWLKRGYDFFPFATAFFRDRKIKKLLHEHNAEGVLAYIYILCAVYGGEEEYFTPIDEEFLEDIACDINISVEKARLIVDFCIKRSLLDSKLFNADKVLSSRGIQRRFQEMAKTRAKTRIVAVDRNLWLLEEDETEGYISYAQKENICGKNSDYSGKNNGFFGKNDTKESKGKKSIVKESRVEESESPAPAAVLRCYEQKIGLLTPSVTEGIEYYSNSGMEDALLMRLIEYACEQGKRSWQYINAAMLGNLNEGITTLDAYLRHQAQRAENKNKGEVKQSRFNNYTDTNKPDYSNFSEQVLKEMLGE